MQYQVFPPGEITRFDPTPSVWLVQLIYTDSCGYSPGFAPGSLAGLGSVCRVSRDRGERYRGLRAGCQSVSDHPPVDTN